MFRALMGGARSSSDARSTTSSSSKSSRRKTDSKSTQSRKSSRGDDRDRGLGDLSVYSPQASGSKRGPPSVAGDSVASTYVTAEPDAIDDSNPVIIERAPRRKDSDRESKVSRRRDRDRSESRERERRKSRRGTGDELDNSLNRERDRRERRRTQSGEHYVPPVSTFMPSSAPGAQFAADIAAPGFSQFPMQYDNVLPPGSSSPGHGSSPAPYDPHVQQQFPGQFPTGIAEPYVPPNPAGAAADYYGDQGQSVSEQPGVRPHQPPVIPNSQAHLMAASASANPPPEPSSLGQVGAAASYFDDESPAPDPQSQPPPGSVSKPPKPGKVSTPSKPSKPSSSGVLPAAAAGVTTYGIGDAVISSHGETDAFMTNNQESASYSTPAPTSTSKPPPHTYGIGTGIGTAAAGAAAGYMLHHHHPSSPAHISQYSYQNFEHSSQAEMPPYGSGPGNAMLATGAAGVAGYAANPAHNPGYYPGIFAMQHRHRGPFTKFVDFWRDPEGVGRFEDYTESIGVCKYCFEPGTTSLDAPRRHHYRGRRYSADRYSSSSSSRVDKLSRYQSSEDESRRRKRSKKSSSWLPGMLAGYAAKSIFTGKSFDDSYSVRSGRFSGDRVSVRDDDHASMSDRRSHTSRGVIRRSEHSSLGEYGSDSKYHRRQRSRSRSRSSSQSGRHSFVKEAALGAAVGSAALAASKSHQRSRSRSHSRVQRRKDSSSSSSFLDVSRSDSKPVGGLASFFTSSSENRKKKKKPSKKRRGFFSFSSSSSSSLDNDLAFGNGFARKSSLSKSKQKGKRTEDVDAALLGLGATAAALAASSHGRSRSTGQILSRSRHSNYNTSANEDNEWVDADSDDLSSSSSANSALAFGGSSAESGSESSRSGWGWVWGAKKKKKNKRSSAADAALAAGAGAFGGAALASVSRRRESRVPSSSGSLQQVYPVPTSDPSRFDAVTIPPSAISDSQPPLVRPGPIPLQQPQPVTPVSQAVYTTQGGYPGSIPAYTAPIVPPTVVNDYDRYDPQLQSRRDPAWSQEVASFVERRKPQRSDSSPVFPTQESPGLNVKRRSTTKDQASVSFNLTAEQAERERRLSRRDRRSRDDFRDGSVQLVDHEAEAARGYSDQGARGHQDRDEEKRQEDERRDERREKESSSSGIEAAAVGMIGVAAVSSLISSRGKEDDGASEASLRRREERREQRRAERRRVSGQDVESSIVSKSDNTPPVGEPNSLVQSRDDQGERPARRSSRTAPVYEDYAEFFAPEELRHSQKDHPSDKPNIIEVVPASERQARDLSKDLPDDLPQFGPEPYENHDHLPWPVPQLNFIEPTPPQSISGSVRGASPIVPAAAPVEVHSSALEESQDFNDSEEPELPKESKRASTGYRVSWGQHSTHEYEVPSSSEYDISPLDESPKGFSVDSPVGARSTDIGTKNDVGADIEFAATVAAATEAAGFDPSVVINDPKYHTRVSPLGSEDEGTFSPRSTWATRKDEPHGFVEGEIGSYPIDEAGNTNPSAEQVIKDQPIYAEPESIPKEEDIPTSKHRNHGSIAQEVIEKLNGKTARSDSPEIDVFSMPGGFETSDNSREVVQSHDDSRSVFSAPVGRESEALVKSRQSRRSGGDLDLLGETQGTSAPPGLVDVDEDKKKRRKRRSKRDSDSYSVDDDARSGVTDVRDEDKSERRKHRHRSSRDIDTFSVEDDARSAVTDFRDEDKSDRRKHRHRSTRDSDTFSIDDDARSAITDIRDEGKSERRKHRHRSSRDSGFDDTASISSSPARFDESREKRRSKDDREKDRSSSSSFLRGLFGSRVSAPEERRRSSSLDKRSSREVMSEAGADDERRRRKKGSSRHRSSSRGDKLDHDGFDQDVGGQDDTNLEEYRSHRQRKEERRRHRYEEIVDSGKRKDSEKDGNSTDYNDDSDKSFLGERPEMPAEGEERGDLGLEQSMKRAALTAANLALSECPRHQRPRSRSISPPAAEKALDLAPKSRSRPSSPDTARPDQTPQSRRTSLVRATTESPTAVPLHFRRPPLSPGLYRSSPNESPRADSPGSPSQARHRRLNSTEFKTSREIRPLWLVERHGSAKVEPDSEEQLPSLPSSKTSSRAGSVENLRTLHDEDAVRSWEPIDLSNYKMERRRPTGLTISTEHANRADDDADILDSQQATPTAEDFGAPSGSAKKELKYEFHSPSELLQDPEKYQELPPSPTMEPLPSAEGSIVGTNDPKETRVSQEHGRGLDVQQELITQPDAQTPTQEKAALIESTSETKGPGFANLVDAAVTAGENDQRSSESVDDQTIRSVEVQANAVDTASGERGLPIEELAEESSPTPVTNFTDSADSVNGAVAAGVSRHDQPSDHEVGEPGTAAEEQPPNLVETADFMSHDQAEATKEVSVEPAESLSEPVQTEQIDEPVAEAVTSSKKKNKKKNKKKGQSSEGIGPTPVEPEPSNSTGDKAADANNLESATRTNESDPSSVLEEPKTESQMELEAKATGTSREIETEPTPTTANEINEALAASELQTEQVAEPGSVTVVATESDSVNLMEDRDSRAEPVTSTYTTAESEQPEDTAGSSKKAKREKKKQKKKAKSTSAVDQAENTLDDAASEQTDAKPLAEEAQPGEGITSAAFEGTSETARASVNEPAVHEHSNLQASQETLGSSQPVPAEELKNEEIIVADKPAEGPTSSDAPVLESRDIGPTEPGPPDVEEAAATESAVESLVGNALPESSPEAPVVPDVDSGMDNDAFHEAVEEQPAEAEKSKDVSADQAADTTMVQPREPEPVEDFEKQPKKKGKKGKKDRKSVSLDETEVPTERAPVPAPEPEPEQRLKDLEPEQSGAPASADTHPPLASSETQPLETEGSVADLPKPASEDDVAVKEPEPAPPGDVEPALTESVDTTNETTERTATDEPVETEPDVPMTAAQKRKAKKDKKKKAKQQSESSVAEEEKPSEHQASELQPAETVEPQPTDDAELQSTELQPAGTVTTNAQPNELSEPSTNVADVETVPDAVQKPTDVNEASSSVTVLEEKKDDSTEGEQLQETAPVPESPVGAVTDIAAEPADAERPQTELEGQQPTTAEVDVPAEPEVPLTAAQKKKAKKAKKKQQQQQQSVSPNPGDTEAPPAPETETAETSKDIVAVPDAEPLPAEIDTASAGELEVADINKEDQSAPDQEVPFSKDDSSSTAKPQTAEDAEVVETVDADRIVAPVSEEVIVPADALSEKEQKDASLDAELPKDEETTVPATESPVVKEAEAREESEAALAEAEAPLTAAQKKKAKKEKKKQQKRQSTQLGEQPNPVTEPEQKEPGQSVEDSAEAEATIPIETSSHRAVEPQSADGTSIEARPAEAKVEIATGFKLDTEEIPGLSTAEDEVLREPSVGDSTTTPVETLDIENVSTAPDESNSESAPVHVSASDEGTQDSLKITPTEFELPKEKAEDENIVSDQPLDTTMPPAESALVTVPAENPTVEDATENRPIEKTEESEPVAPKSRKDKKKKMRQSPGLENERQPELVNENDSEPAPSEGDVMTLPVETTEGSVISELTPKPSEPVADEITNDDNVPNELSAEASEAHSKPISKKQAKKDKKKRKSVAWEDEASVAPDSCEPNQDPPASADTQQAKDVPIPDTPLAQEGSEEPVASLGISEPATDNMVPETTETTHLDGDLAVAEGEKSLEQPESASSPEPTNIEAVSPAPDVRAERHEPPIEPTVRSDENPVALREPPTSNAEDPETAAGAGLSAKERRKLKKKEKKKSKAADLTADDPSVPVGPSQESEVHKDTEASLNTPLETPRELESEVLSTQADHSETPEDNVSLEVEKPSAAELVDTENPEKSTEAKSEVEETIETVKTDNMDSEPEKTAIEGDKSAELEVNQSTESANPRPATEIVGQPDSSSASNGNTTPEQTAEPEPEVSMSAKERRKAKKKEKKRQSKNLDIDDAATTSLSSAEPAQPSPSEAITAELKPAASTEDVDKSASPETDPKDSFAWVTAPSPAEHDGKEHQSHDTETLDAPEIDLASTDKFVSSQVEQSRIESHSSDIPPQPGLEHDVGIGEPGGSNAQEEDGGPNVAFQSDVQAAEVERATSVDIAKTEDVMKDVSESVPVQKEIQSSKADDHAGDVQENPSVLNLNEPDNVPVPNAAVENAEDTTVVAGQETPAEEAAQPALSKKQKKKDKKKKQKQQQEEEKLEEVAVPDPEILTVEGSKEPESVPALREPSGAESIVEPEPIAKQDNEPVAGEASEEQTPDSVEQSAPRSPENVEVTTVEMSMEADTTVSDSFEDTQADETEVVPLSRKLSKKQKKKQRQALLALKTEPENSTAPEASGTSVLVPEVVEISLSNNVQQDDQAFEQQDTAATEFSEVVEVEEMPKDVDVPVAEVPCSIPSDEAARPESPIGFSLHETEMKKAEETDVPGTNTPVQTMSTEPAPEQPSGEPAVEAEEEAPILSTKLSKKEKKKRQAVAATIENDGTMELQGAPTGPVEQSIEREMAQPTYDIGEPTEPNPRTVKSVGTEDFAELAPPSGHGQEIADLHQEPSRKDLEAVEAMGETDKVVEENNKAEPITRKLSKKEKKAKRQGKQSLLDAPAVTAEELVLENSQSSELQEGEVALESGTMEAGGNEQQKRLTTPEPDSTSQGSAFEGPPKPESEALAAAPQLSDRDLIPQEQENDELATGCGFPASANASRPEDGEVQIASAQQSAAQALIGNVSSEKQAGEEDNPCGEEPQNLGDPEVAGDLIEDRAQEPDPETLAPASKKLSKKEKRKAKKKGNLEETSNVKEREVVSTSNSVELQDLEGSTPSLEVHPAPFAEPELQLPAESEGVKASQGLDQPVSTNKASEEEDLIESVEREDLSKDIELPESVTKDAKNDDEWPTIEWGNERIDKPEAPQVTHPEVEDLTAVPVAEAIPEYDEAAIPAALQEVLDKPAVVGEEAWPMPLSKKDKKKAKKNKRKSEQAALTEQDDLREQPLHKKIEINSDAQPDAPLEANASISDPTTIETEPPARTTTPGGSRIANLFPDLERGGFRRSALEKRSPSPKDSADEESAADLVVNRDNAIPLSEAPNPFATIETKEPVEASSGAPPEQAQQTTPAAAEHHTSAEVISPKEKPSEVELVAEAECSLLDTTLKLLQSDSKNQSSTFSGSTQSTRTEDPSSPLHLLQSQIDEVDDSSCGLRRTPSIIHGRHQHTPRTWSLEEASIHAVRSPSPPRSLFGGPFVEHDTLSRPRTPLDTIAEQEPGDGDRIPAAQHDTPRLEVKPEHVLPRPHTPVRKFTDNALAREAWPTPENDKRSHDDLLKSNRESASPILKTPEQSMPVLKPSNSKGKLRRTNRSASGDLRAVSRSLDSQPPPNLDLDQLPSSSSYDPVTDKGKRPLRNMSDVYEGWGETPSSPRSPSRPPSVRRRRSMQHLQDLESRLDQLISENRLLIAARDEAEDKLRNASVARRKSDRALNSSGADLRDKEAEVEQLKNSVEWLQREMSRLTQENESLTASNAALAAAHAEEVHNVRESSTRELDVLRSQHTELSTQMEDRVRQEIETALAQKDAELRRLREELEEARDKVKELQQQISASVHDNALVFRDEDYFEAASQKLCGHVQQWVLRFSKHSDHRRCRSLSELHDEKVADRFDNALLDGSDADAYLADRVNRRNVFMSVVMTMVWEYIFTRYLFGMDREQRQKLKSLEKQLSEVGPRRAVHRWRATTLTLLSRRPAFASQRQSDTEAVALEIFGTLSRVLPPPSHVEAQLLESLRKVLRVAVNLSLEMRTQLAEFIMLPPLQPEYDTNGDLARQVYFNASLMNERSGETTSNDELEAQQAIVRIVLFPLVVKKGNDLGEGDDEVVVCPAQVLVARPGKEKRVSRMMSGDRMSLDASRSVHSMAPSSMMDMSNVI